MGRLVDYFEYFCYVEIPLHDPRREFLIKSIDKMYVLAKSEIIDDKQIIFTKPTRYDSKSAFLAAEDDHEQLNKLLLRFYKTTDFRNDLLFFDTRSSSETGSYYVGIINNKYEQILFYHIHPDMDYDEFFKVVPKRVIRAFKLLPVLSALSRKSSEVSSAQEKDQSSTTSSTPSGNTSDKLRYQELLRREQEQKNQAAIRKKREEEQKKAKMYQDIARKEQQSREKQADAIARFSKIKSVDKKQIIDYAESLLRKFDIRI